MEKSFLSVNQQRSPSLRAADQSHLNVQLHPVNDGISHHSQSSYRLKNVSESEVSFRSSPELKKNNDLNGINSDTGSPFLTSLSPISMSSSLYIQSSKPSRNNSLRYDKTSNKYYHISPSPNVYTDSIIAESPLFSEKMSEIAKKRSFNSYNNSNNEEDIKLLSSKHYILSNFEGDYNKEELNLHYGDIVSIINILPDGWAYGELLLKYDSYTKTNVKPSKGSKYRKFGYYPLKCITPEEESEETNTPPKILLEEDDSKDLKLINISTDEDETESINKNYTIEKEILSEKNSNKSLPPPLPKTHRSRASTLNTDNSVKRRSIRNFFKRTSADFSMKQIPKDEITDSSNSERLSPNDIIISNSKEESDTETIYHDADDEGSLKSFSESKKNDQKRYSKRSSLSFQ